MGKEPKENKKKQKEKGDKDEKEEETSEDDKDKKENEKDKKENEKDKKKDDKDKKKDDKDKKKDDKDTKKDDKDKKKETSEDDEKEAKEDDEKQNRKETESKTDTQQEEYQQRPPPYGYQGSIPQYPPNPQGTPGYHYTPPYGQDGDEFGCSLSIVRSLSLWVFQSSVAAYGHSQRSDYGPIRPGSRRNPRLETGSMPGYTGFSDVEVRKIFVRKGNDAKCTALIVRHWCLYNCPQIMKTPPQSLYLAQYNISGEILM
ncbi:hypothetical protein TNCV_2102391 [Trichonephila clavipes]|nr:hypothetical protein TNCV_2102391 [Trichonephila clavipes]